MFRAQELQSIGPLARKVQNFPLEPKVLLRDILVCLDHTEQAEQVAVLKDERETSSSVS